MHLRFLDEFIVHAHELRILSDERGMRVIFVIAQSDMKMVFGADTPTAAEKAIRARLDKVHALCVERYAAMGPAKTVNVDVPLTAEDLRRL
jgi:hypothetical protein